MARTRATIHCSIHGDAEWLALSPEAKLVYLTVTSQTGVSLAGCLDWNSAKWAKLTGYSPSVTNDALDELIEARFLVVDEDTFECVVRTFTVWDVGAQANSNTVKGMVSAWKTILSPRLRRVVFEAMPDRLRTAVLEDAKECGTGDLLGNIGDGTGDGTAVRTVDETVDGSTDRTTSTGTGTVPGTENTRSSAGSDSSGLVPVDGSPPMVAVNDPKPTINDEWERWWAVYPKKVGKQAARRAWDRARKRRPPDELQAALESHLPAWATIDPQFVPNPATWLGPGRYDDPPPKPRTGPSRPNRVDENMAKIQRSLQRMGAS